MNTGATRAPATSRPAGRRRTRVCLVYDCLFPYTIGGGERWYRNLGERLAAEDHDVTYLTLRQWDRSEQPDGGPGVRVLAVGPRMGLYARGRRRILPPLVFGAGVLAHLLRHGRHYDVVHVSSFPYFSLLAAAAVRPLARYALVVDWFEVWSAGYWEEYLGRWRGRVGEWVQRRCASIPQFAFCLSQVHARRLGEQGLRSQPAMLHGLHHGRVDRAARRAAEPLVVFAGRMIPEKRAHTVVPAVVLAAQRIPGLRGIVFGDGPDRERVLAAIAEAGPDAPVSAPGFVSNAEIEDALARALCMILPTRREGLGTVVIEAAALGVPSVVVAGPDNGATELIEPGRNGFVAASTSAEDLAEAIVAAHEGGEELRRQTALWFDQHARELSLEGSLELVLDAYRRLRPDEERDLGAA